MSRLPYASRQQLALLLESETTHPLAEETREAVVAALADLLLEALGKEMNEQINGRGDFDESEDHV